MGVNLLSSWQQKLQTLKKRKKAKECTVFTFTTPFNMGSIPEFHSISININISSAFPFSVAYRLVLRVCPRSNTENQILKAGFTSREIVIMENDDPGGVFEFSPSSRGPWLINVSPNWTSHLQKKKKESASL